jgi:anti-sigma factor RsiW
MNCDEYRKRRTLAEGEANFPDDVRVHFAECEECRIYLHEQERLRMEVRKLAEIEHAPPALRESVADLLHEPHAPRRQGTKRWAAAAAAVLVMAGVGTGYVWYRHAGTPTPERLAQDFISDHLHYLPGREQIVSDSAQQVQDWFQGRVEFPVHVPDVPGAVLEDARVCDISGRKAALLHYRRNPGDALISVFVAEEPKSFDRQMKSGTLVASNQGLNSTLWCHRGLLYDVVGPLDDSSLQQIAESVRKQEP